ncbi:MAG: nucleotidyltransferase domain-containing protein [Desulfuromonadales bacterium]|nr:nucleotidyltransferase domain-containing protein [Desulfuromonadales bacterium]MDT8424014.1 nucleotidyltransferase domain-containing protein [Desulfuromonadales bacterium]
MTEHEALDEIVRRLVAAAQPERIVLFGSRAREEAGADSDFDLLVIEREPFDAKRSRLVEIGRLEAALGRLPYATDLLVYSSAEVARRGISPHHVVARALREGTVVYARH